MTTTGTHATSTTPVAEHPVVSREQWLKERIALLADEKQLMRQNDALASRVRALPWVKVEKPYIFDAPAGGAKGAKKSLADLFGARSQLVIYHFMFDPTWSQGCMGCSFLADHYNGIVVHLAQRDISFVTVSKASIEQIERFRARMGWTIPWVSGANCDFGRDFAVSFTDQELADDTSVYNFTNKPFPFREHPGLSVFTRNARGEVFHTYSTFARGLENFLTAYRYIDITPNGRHEEQTSGMGWVRHHDRYGDANFVVPWAERPGITAPLPR